MASAPEIRMESSKVNLIAQLLAAALSIIQDAVNPTPPSLETPIKSSPRRNKRTRTVARGTNGKNGEDHEDPEPRSGVVVPIGPLLRSPVDPNKEYDLKFAAKYLEMSRQTIVKRIESGALTAEKKGNGRGAWWITGEEIIRFSNSTTGDDE